MCNLFQLGPSSRSNSYCIVHNYCITLLQLSFGPIGWLMISEIFPLRLRGRGLSIAVLVNFGANALVTFAFSPLVVRCLLSF